MVKRILGAALFLAAGLAYAQPTPTRHPPKYTVATAPACVDAEPKLYSVTDGNSSTDCAVGGGSTDVICQCKDGSASAVGSGGGAAGNSFETINAPAGTDPVADSATDTLAITCAGGLTCTGDSATDTLDFTMGTASAATALAANPADCAANQFAQSIVASGDLTCAAIADADVPDTITVTLAGTATALAANGANCSAGNYPLGVDAAGAVESCTADDDTPDSDSEVPDSITVTGSVSPSTFTFPASAAPAQTTDAVAAWDSDDNRLTVGDGAATLVIYPGAHAGAVTDGGAATTATALAANGANCSANQYPLGVDASGAAESCTADDDLPDADEVTESMLKAVDAASDEECLTYESTVGDFEWQTCGSAGNSFETINAPAGTDPVADSATDTLNVTCAGGLTCTGDSATDTLDFTMGTASAATALAADPADCSANQFANAIAASGALTCSAIADADVPDTITVTLAGTATALAANGANCSSGNYPLGVDASGAVESCTADDDTPDNDGEVPDSITVTGAVSPSTFTFPASAAPAQTTDAQAAWDSDDNRLTVGDGAATLVIYPGAHAGAVTDGGAATTATALAANGANCSANQYPLGVDASGAAESCTADDDLPDADEVTESMLKAVDAASDEECLTYESTVGDFEWQTCGSAGNSFETINAPAGTDPVADSSTDTLNWTAGTGIAITGDSTTDTITVASTIPTITLDLGDDGGNDSTALAEIAVTGDDYGVVSEPSADKALLAFAKVPPYRQYDPDRPPASCASCEEWTGDAAALTWRWANQDSATSAIAYDGETITGDATNELHVRFTTAPSNTDQTATARIGYTTDGSTATGDACGLVVLHGGTEDSPSNLTYLMTGDFATDGIYLQSDSNYDPAAGTTSHASIGWSISTTQAQQLHYQLRYTDSARALLAYYSWDGKTWTPLGTAVTLAADPVSWGFFTRLGAICRAEWFRLRTDANRNDASD